MLLWVILFLLDILKKTWESGGFYFVTEYNAISENITVLSWHTMAYPGNSGRSTGASAGFFRQIVQSEMRRAISL